MLIGCAVDSNDPNAAAGAEDAPASEVSGQAEALKNSENGLATVNGLTTVNGLPTVNGLASVNGLPTVNGLISVNGLPTVNGLVVAADGSPLNTSATLAVDCGASGVVGKDCWGTPDGLMSYRTGMLRSDAGITTAHYLVRCALPATKTVGFVNYKGQVERMTGELNLAPEIATGTCDAKCQENISACLMAFTNAAGVHVPLVMSSTKDNLGGGKDSAYPWQEGAFFGNLFTNPPKGFFCKGSSQQNIATMWFAYAADAYNARMCPNGSSFGSNACPYASSGDCTGMPWSPHACSAASDGTMTSCSGGGKTWNYPITTYLKSKSAT